MDSGPAPSGASRNDDGCVEGPAITVTMPDRSQYDGMALSLRHIGGLMPSAPITTAAASGTSFFITMKTLRPATSSPAGALTNETTVASVGMLIVCSPPL